MLELVQGGDQQRDRGEPALIAGITREMMREHPVDPRRVYVAGLSAGGAAAAVMGVTYPDLYAAVGVHSGLAAGAARDLPSAFAAMRGARPRLPGRPAAGQAGATCRPSCSTATRTARCTRATATRSSSRPQSRRRPAGDGDVAARPGRRRPWLQPHVHADAAAGRPRAWVIHGAGHAWSGGSPAGSYTDPQGPDASREMLRFFWNTRIPRRRRPRPIH